MIAAKGDFSKLVIDSWEAGHGLFVRSVPP
jgi:hypothetical protein